MLLCWAHVILALWAAFFESYSLAISAEQNRPRSFHCADLEIFSPSMLHSWENSFKGGESGGDQDQCILKKVSQEDAFRWAIGSKLKVSQREASPDSQAWAHCESCFWHMDRFQVVNITDDASASLESSNSSYVDMSWSNWGEFFHSPLHQDRVRAEFLHMPGSQANSQQRYNDLFDGYFVIDRPVFYIPVIAFHYGHILIDVLEPVFGAMMETYGSVQKDALIMLDTSNPSQRELLPDILNKHCNVEEVGAHYCSLLRTLTNLPILSSSHLLKDRRIFLTDIHIGGNLEQSFYASGNLRKPCLFSPDDMHANALSDRYTKLRSWLWNQILGFDTEKDESGEPGSSSEADTVVVQRQQSREISNIQDVLAVLQNLSFHSSVVYLENMPLASQVRRLYRSKRLVVTAGTAVHGMLFMKPGSSVVLLMQAEWCEWSWMYFNQGTLLGIHVHVLCESGDFADLLKRTRHSSFTNKFWKHGPGGSKASNITVDLDRLEMAFRNIDHNLSDPNDDWCFGINAESISRQEYHNPNAIDEPELDTKQLLSYESHYSSLEKPFARVSIASISASYAPHPEVHLFPGTKLLKLKLHADITTYQADMSKTFEYFPHITVCSKIWVLPEREASGSGPFCLRADALNYLSTMNFHLDVTKEEAVMHMWLQTSERGGIISNSDGYAHIDIRLPNAGLISPASFGHRVVECQVVIGRREYKFSHEVSYRGSFQHAIADFCRQQSLLSHCYDAAYQISKCALQDNALPSIQQLPTPQDPFVFLHMEKVGGTSLRKMFHDAVMAINLTKYFIASHNGLSHLTFTLPDRMEQLEGLSVIAGHFEWGVWNLLPRLSALRGHSSSSVPACFLMGRHPVDRVISYFYQRCYDDESCPLHSIRFKDLSISQALDFIWNVRQAQHKVDEDDRLIFVDDGIHESMCRTLLGDKTSTGRKVDDVLEMFNGEIPPHSKIDEDKYQVAIANMEKCVVGLLEEWDMTTEMIKYWYPWMKPALNDSNSRDVHLMKLYSGKETASDIDPRLRKAVEGILPCDMALYSKMKERFERQRQHLKKSNNLQRKFSS